jgi:hypothetical protein
MKPSERINEIAKELSKGKLEGFDKEIIGRWAIEQYLDEEWEKNNTTQLLSNKK